MSCPALNALPAPVRTSTSVAGSTASSSSVSSISRWTCGLMALRLSGRLIISQVMPPSFSTWIASYFLAAGMAYSLCVPVGAFNRSWPGETRLGSRRLPCALGVGRNGAHRAQRFVDLLHEADVGQLLAQRAAVVGQAVRDHGDVNDRFFAARSERVDGMEVGLLALGAAAARQFLLQQKNIDRRVVEQRRDALDIDLLAAEAGETGIQRIADEGADAEHGFEALERCRCQLWEGQAVRRRGVEQEAAQRAGECDAAEIGAGRQRRLGEIFPRLDDVVERAHAQDSGGHGERIELFHRARDRAGMGQRRGSPLGRRAELDRDHWLADAPPPRAGVAGTG